MKKLLAILSAAALLCAVGCGCGTDGAQQDVTEQAVTTAQAIPAAEDFEDEVALPQENNGGSTTKPVIETTASTTAFQRSSIMQELATIPQTPPQTDPPAEETPAETEQAEPGEQAEQPEQPAMEASTTAKPEETTAKPTAELLESSVLKHIQSGTYTITVSAFGKDHDSNDKVSKIVRGGAAAYFLTFPAQNMTVKVFPSDGKYYMTMSGKYCELTKSQYDHLASCFNNAFCDFTALRGQFQTSETVREGLRKYTREDYTVGGKDLSLWYSGGSLFKLEMATENGTESLPTTVTGTAESFYFTPDASAEAVGYADLESAAMLIELFFGA